MQIKCNQCPQGALCIAEETDIIKNKSVVGSVKHKYKEKCSQKRNEV